MSTIKPGSLVAVTGAAGFLGRTLASELSRTFSVRLADIVPANADVGEVIVGDITERSVVERVCDGANAIVIAHMAPRGGENYDFPDRALDINVKATAMLLEQAVRSECERAVIISSICAHRNAEGIKPRKQSTKPRQNDNVYSLTKRCQELVAFHYYEQFGIPIGILRPAYIVDAETLMDKYGNKRPTVNWMFIDSRDLASAVVATLQLDYLECEIFDVFGHPDADKITSIARTRDRLGWAPVHTFAEYTSDPIP